MHRIAFLAGLFVVPLVLLALGHHYRRRSPAQRGVFWGATTGYLMAMIITAAAAVLPPLYWNDGPLRILLVHWSMLLGAAAGAGAALLHARLRT